MNATATGKTGYISRAYATLGMKISDLAQRILGEIEGYSRISPDSRYRQSLSKIAEEHGVSVRQTVRTIKKISERGLISKEFEPKQACASYRANTNDERRGFVRTPKFLREKEFTFYYKKDKKDPNSEVITFTRTLTRIEETTLCVMFEWQAENGKAETTVRNLAQKIGRSIPTAQQAIDALIHCDAIHRTSLEKSTSRRRKSIYHVDGELFREIQRAFRTTKKTAQEQKPKQSNNMQAHNAPVQVKSAEVINADARSARERYYSALRAEAEYRADKVKERLRSVPEYAKAESNVSKMQIKLAKAEISEDYKTLNRLRKARKQYQAIMFEIMQELGYKKGDDIAQYKCKRCSDTGHVKDGRACTCYPKGGVK